MADFGRHEMDSEMVSVDQKKVMGAVTSFTEKDTTGGSIMKTGTYSVKSASNESKKLSSANRSGFNGTTSPSPKYQ